MLESLIYTAQRAGGAIMSVHAAGFAVRDKADAALVFDSRTPRCTSH